MIIGIGMDLVEVERVATMLARHGARAERKLFTPAEVTYCRRGAGSAQSFAARFAAKEAFFKALGTGIGGAGGWTEVEVVRAGGGAPELRLSGEARRQAEGRGVARIHLALTHTAGMAGATVVLEAAAGRDAAPR
jgi:holo-[acyl-carrier protein] synthase